MDGLILKYFVLKPKGNDIYAVASRNAIRTYADSIKVKNEKLAKELLEWIKRETLLATGTYKY